MKKSDSDRMRSDRVAKILGSTGTYTRVFGEHPADVRDHLISVASSLRVGQPLAAAFASKDTWTLLTATHLAWREESKTQSLMFSDIKSIRLTQDDMEEILREPSRKALVDTLEVVASSGHVYHVSLEGGVPLYRFWRAIRLLAFSNFGRSPESQVP